MQQIAAYCVVISKNKKCSTLSETVLLSLRFKLKPLELLRKNILIKLKKKNRGNIKLIKAIDKLVADIEKAKWTKQTDIKEFRPDADCVHSDGFYFFDLNVHRTMILVVFEDNEATVIWSGSHVEYDKTFKGNKNTIEKWLRAKKLI